MADDRPRATGAKEVETFTPVAASVAAVMARAQECGLTKSKGSRISGRVDSELIERAKARTGLRSDTALIEFALANVALDDRFAETFRALRGSVDPELDLDF